jgi:bifunctional DNA-binding transcriptional regulator/antitoxin component of YhaV-PrlF toxin-antitoxin module
LRAKYGLHAGDEVEVIEVGGTLQVVRAEGAESIIAPPQADETA